MIKLGVKQHVLSVLEMNKGKNVSGAKIANELSISRNAVWKSIKALQEEGYSINAVTNKGYCLSVENDILSDQSIEPYLEGKSQNLRLSIQKSVTSTNTLLKELASRGEAEGKVLIAETQTMGRGRLGRAFYSPEKTGIYMSILLRPKLTIEDSLYITTSAAVAVAKAIEKVADCEAKIKWVNDIYCNGRKVCGILTEAGIDFESGGLEYAVLGIGINVSSPEEGFPEELKNIATSIFEEKMYSSNVRSRLVAEILNNFWEYYENISQKTFLEEYRNRSFLLGKEIEIISGDKIQYAQALEIDNNARLVVKLSDGELKTLSSGEVSVKPINMMIELTEKILMGHRIKRGDDLEYLLNVDIGELCKGADKIREFFCGNKVNLCTIINGRSGKCSEDCKFCAQSGHHNTGILEYSFLDTDTIVADCKNNEAEGVHRYSIVTAGKNIQGKDLELALATYKKMKAECNIELCASHGLLTEDAYIALKEAGVKMYHENIETSKRNFPNICSTHTYKDKLHCIKLAQAVGLEVCSGGIIGMGETWEDRIDMAVSLSELGIRSIPINVLMPIKGTPFDKIPPITEDEVLRTIAIFRLINPEADIRLAAGRATMKNSGEKAFHAGANATITGNMLTTSGNDIKQDIEMLTQLGFDVTK